jgi:hypothetical protein
MEDIFLAVECDCEIVTESWLKEQIGSYEPLPVPECIPISEREAQYPRKFEGDTYLEEFIALEIASTDYKIGTKCHRNNHPKPVYVVTKLDIISPGNVSATIELIYNPDGLPPETVMVMEKKKAVNVTFLPSEEQQLFLEKYRLREVEEGVWKHRLAPEFISEMNRRLDRFADDQVFDYVPGTDCKVRVLIDPSLYAIRRSNSIFSLFSWSAWLVGLSTFPHHPSSSSLFLPRWVIVLRSRHTIQPTNGMKPYASLISNWCLLKFFSIAPGE